ncbi:hypothetical protein DENSPDRAFT_433700 [Dentipellis sp. KUC8613]|nr:hypothetical protein DENSPDRAFT_433700 [Dentipellis sp. KUC8613]
MYRIARLCLLICAPSTGHSNAYARGDLEDWTCTLESSSVYAFRSGITGDADATWHGQTLIASSSQVRSPAMRMASNCGLQFICTYTHRPRAVQRHMYNVYFLREPTSPSHSFVTSDLCGICLMPAAPWQTWHSTHARASPGLAPSHQTPDAGRGTWDGVACCATAI